MRYDDFKQECERHGLTAKRCSSDHWQIKGGSRNDLVNCWPHSKRGFIFNHHNTPGIKGCLDDAIQLAGPKPTQSELMPWDDQPQDKHNVQPERVGLIRTIWRWIW